MSDKKKTPHLTKMVLDVVFDTFKRGIDFIGYVFLGYCIFALIKGMFDMWAFLNDI